MLIFYNLSKIKLLKVIGEIQKCVAFIGKKPGYTYKKHFFEL
jgi:hypothetical protein